MADIDTFTEYPLSIDVQTHVHHDLKTKKKTPVQVAAVASPSNVRPSRALQSELESLNQLHKDLILNDPENADPVFPPSIPMDPRRSALVDNWLEIGTQEFRKGNYEGAVNAYKLGLKVEYERPLWDWHDKVRDEVSGLSFKLAEAYLALEEWSVARLYAETGLDIENGTEMKILSQKPSNPFEAEQMRQAVERVRSRREKLGELFKKAQTKMEEKK